MYFFQCSSKLFKLPEILQSIVILKTEINDSLKSLGPDICVILVNISLESRSYLDFIACFVDKDFRCKKTHHASLTALMIQSPVMNKLLGDKSTASGHDLSFAQNDYLSLSVMNR